MEEELLKIINHYGITKQLKYIHSEYFELDEAILHYENSKYFSDEYDIDDTEHIAEELADVMVMLKQFQLYYDITDEKIKEIMQQKIDRQLERIENETFINS